MKLKALLLSLVMLTAAVSSAVAETPDNHIALDATPIGTSTASFLSTSKIAPKPVLTPSQQLGDELSKMFQEGAAKLDAPKPKSDNAEAVAIDGGVPAGGRSLNVMAYSYCLNGRTASGRYTSHGCVAVDTRVIPMGSKLYIPGYGWAVAADTGGAIVGNKIDVWFPSSGQCYQWGVRPVTIKVFPR